MVFTAPSIDCLQRKCSWRMRVSERTPVWLSPCHEDQGSSHHSCGNSHTCCLLICNLSWSMFVLVMMFSVAVPSYLFMCWRPSYLSTICGAYFSVWLCPAYMSVSLFCVCSVYNDLFACPSCLHLPFFEYMLTCLVGWLVSWTCVPLANKINFVESRRKSWYTLHTYYHFLCMSLFSSLNRICGNKITTVGYIENWRRKRNNSSSFSYSVTDLHSTV